MLTSRITVAVLLSFTVVSTVEAQGLGGLIKRKAAEAVGADKSKTAETKPVTDHGSCGDVTDDVMERFLKGLEVEAAETRAATEEMAKAEARTYDEDRACHTQAQMSPEARKIQEEWVSSASTGDPVKANAKYVADLEALRVKRCGKTKDELTKAAYARRDGAYKAGLAASGMEEACYLWLKEHAYPFCVAPAALQQKASEKGLATELGPDGRKVGVYTPNQARKYKPHCSRIVSLMDVIYPPVK
jgi:hypothetical protein